MPYEESMQDSRVPEINCYTYGKFIYYEEQIEQHGGDVNCFVTENGLTLAHIACARNDIPGLEYLISRGVDLNKRAKNELGPTPLISHVASKLCSWKMLKFLLKNGANYKKRDNVGNTVLHAACVNCRERELQFLHQHLGYHCNFRNHHGVTPILCAISNNNITAFRFLQHCEAEMSLGKDGNSIAHYAAMYGHVDIMQDLFQKGCVDLDSPNLMGRTPFHQACYSGHVNVCEFLIRTANIRTNTVDIAGVSAIHYAAAGGHLACMDYLANNVGLDLLEVNSLTGDTITHVAAMNDDIHMLKFLARRGKLLCSLNCNGKRPVWVAMDGCQANSIMFFLKHKLVTKNELLDYATEQTPNSILQMIDPGMELRKVRYKSWQERRSIRFEDTSSPFDIMNTCAKKGLVPGKRTHVAYNRSPGIANIKHPDYAINHTEEKEWFGNYFAFLHDSEPNMNV